MDISPVTSSYVLERNDWLDSQHGTDATETVTLDLAAFDASQYADGRIPSGTVLGVITASSLYGPYVAGASDGTETAAGILYGDVHVAAGKTTGNLGGALLWHGAIRRNKLPFQSGQTGGGFLDTAGEADLTHIRVRTN